MHNPDSYNIFRKAREESEKILKDLGMAFGAVDFIVDSKNNLWFLEVNSAPGLADLSRPIYIDAFNKLKEMPLEDVLKYTER